MTLRGFSLIELLVVVLIVGILMAMSLGSTRALTREASIRLAAEDLAGVLRETRARAVADGVPYGVAFHIQNGRGTSGKVLNNWDGGHWYRVIGPSRAAMARGANDRLLLAYPNNDMINYGNSLGNSRISVFPQFLEEIKKNWVSEARALPARKVRFLALGDTDEGARINAADQSGGGYWAARGYGYTSTYPRPYFGYFDPARKRLFAWGGYDPALQASEPWRKYDGTDAVGNYTGFFYQGSGPAVVGSLNPDDRVYQVDWNQDRDFADVHPAYGSESSYALWRQGEPRPLVNADWNEHLVVFLPDGTAFVPPFKTSTRRFRAGQAVANPANAFEAIADGADDRTKTYASWGGVDPGKWGQWMNSGVGSAYRQDSGMNSPCQTEVAHFSEHHQGWMVATLAGDADIDDDAYPSADAALRALGPMYRILVTKRGEVRTIRVSVRPDSMLAGRTVWPSSPAKWTSNTSADMAAMGVRCRWGWMHQDKGRNGSTLSTTAMPIDAMPRGKPIVDMVCPRMMTDKIWWLDE